LFLANRSSYPDRKEGQDEDVDNEELPDQKNMEYDDDTLELTLPSGDSPGLFSIKRLPVFSFKNVESREILGLSVDLSALCLVIQALRSATAPSCGTTSSGLEPSERWL